MARLGIVRSFWLAGLVLWTLACVSADAAEPRRVLLLHSFGPQFVPWNFITSRFREELTKQSPEKIDLYETSLESARFAPTEDQAPIIGYLNSLFAERKLDLIVAMGAPAARFVQRFRPQFFPSTPLLIAAAERRSVDEAALTANDTYVGTSLDFTRWITHILDVLPDTTHIAWAVGASPLERFWTEYFRRASEPLTGKVSFEWFTELSFEQMLERVAKLPPHSAIFFVDLRVDAAGVPLDSERVLEKLNAVTRAPIFSYVDGYLGRGVVGGPMMSTEELGRRLAAVSVRILGGEQPGSIKMAPLAEATPAYDWRELRRWGIAESALPAGSEIRFREPDVWDRYRFPILGILAAVLLQTALISWLIYEHRRRSLAEVRSRNAMAELAHMNRLETAGQLSASIAHEINQPVTGIILKASAALRWLAVDKPDVDKVKSALADIVGAGQRAGDIIMGVRAMFKKGMTAKSAINLNNLINTVLALLHLDLQKDDVRVETQLDQNLPAVTGDVVQLQQVILNLIVNAAEAMRTVDSRILKIESTRNASGTVSVSIEDSGIGIGEADRSRIFDPLFTTKTGGMGMGLSICRSIIESHGGKIWVSAAPLRGAIFRFELPASDSRDARQDLAA